MSGQHCLQVAVRRPDAVNAVLRPKVPRLPGVLELDGTPPFKRPPGRSGSASRTSGASRARPGATQPSAATPAPMMMTRSSAPSFCLHPIQAHRCKCRLAGRGERDDLATGQRVAPASTKARRSTAGNNCRTSWRRAVQVHAAAQASVQLSASSRLTSRPPCALPPRSIGRQGKANAPSAAHAGQQR